MRSLSFIAAILLGSIPSAGAVSEQVLYAFTLASGVAPNGLTFDRAGNIYGTTSENGGLVFELSPSALGWTEKILYSFTGGSDGSAPTGSLIFDAAGNLYGTTAAGGSGCYPTGCGVIYELSPSPTGWNEIVLYTFTGGTDGHFPIGTLATDGQGNLYGVASYGGDTSSCSCGTVYRLSRTASGWKFNVLHSFAGGNDGAEPNAGLLKYSGSLYGTASMGGNPVCTGFPFPGCGVVFRLSPSAGGGVNYQVVYFFGQTAADGAYPFSSLIADSAGNLYGTTLGGGTAGGGTAFKLSSASQGWQESTLYSFGATGDGYDPAAPLALDSLGNLYGTTQFGGGPGDHGIAFRLTPHSDGTWVETLLHAFTGGLDGQNPSSGLVIGRGPGLYGSTSAGGSTFSAGVVYEITK